MKTGKVFLITTASLLFLSSCGKKAPKCSDKEVQESVINIFYEQVYNAFADKFFPTWQRSSYSQAELEIEMTKLRTTLFRQYPLLDSVKTGYKLEGIITTNFDKNTGAYTCKGTLKTFDKSTKKEISKEIPTTYLVEVTEDGKSFQVTLDV